MLQTLTKLLTWPLNKQGRLTQPAAGLARRGPYNRTYKVGADGYGITLRPGQDQRHMVIGKSGSGKSYLTGVLMEETLNNKGLLCVIDPEGEHHTLGERYPLVVVGGDKGAIPYNPDTVAAVLERMLTRRVSVVWDLSEVSSDTQREAYTLIAETLFTLQQRRPDRQHNRVTLVVDECQLFAPETGLNKAMRATSENVAKRGRKYGIDSLWATQRPSSVDKDVLSQCEHFWFGALTDINDVKTCLQYLSGLLPEACRDKPEDALRKLNKGHFWHVQGDSATMIKVRERRCRHVS